MDGLEEVMVGSGAAAVAAAEDDCSTPGSIVWVRRRNGSWWPGKILDSDELSPSHIMSPRSGTPVKLLGREDASVDWYNLEKSKRVKAFRCGDFDDCIDKAEKSVGVPIKKREKYARREDAILHALELEREQLQKKQKKLVKANSAGSRKSTVMKRDLGTSSECLGNGDGKFVNRRSHSQAKGLDSSLKVEGRGNPLYVQKGKHGKQSSCEEDKSEAIPRMRGLQDFGLRIAPKRKVTASAVCEGSRRPSSVDNHVHVLRSGNRSLGGAGPVTSSKNLLPFKRKRNQSGLLEESSVKRRDRRRPLLQVLQSSAKLPANNTLHSDGDVSPSMQGEKELSGVVCRAKRSRCVYLPAESNDSLDRTACPDEMQISSSQFGVDNCHLNPGSLTEETTTSGLMDETESDYSRSDSDMDEEDAVLSDSIQTQPTAETNGFVRGQTESMSSEELDQAATGNDHMSCPHFHDQAGFAAADVGVSKWQLKGKRNIRNLMNRPIGNSEKRSNGFIHETYYEGKGNWSNQRTLGEQSRYIGCEALDYEYDDDEVIEKNPLHNEMPGFRNRRCPSRFKGMSKDFRRDTDIVDSEEDSIWEPDGTSEAAFRGYWDDESGECYDPIYAGARLGNGKDCTLVDVDLKVQASYQGEHVPLVSLMSRLNGKAIVGHPIQIEAIEDGASDIFLCTSNDFIEEPTVNDGNTALPPVWRTARRTAMHRIPRPHPSTALRGDSAGVFLQYSDPESKPPYNKSHALHPDQIAGKSSGVCRPIEKNIPKKSIKKVSLSSQKTRKLSSIAIEQKLNGKGGSHKVVNKSRLDGLIKAENGPTTVTCIPVKLVFSRLLEAVGRPPYRPKNHIITINGDTERKQM